MEQRIRLLLVEDDRVDQLAFTRAVKEQGWPYDWVIAASIKEARAALETARFDVVVTDYLLGDGVAFEIFPLVPAAALIVTTGSGNEAVAVKAMKGGADDYLIKDPERNYLMMLPFTVESALERRRSRVRVAQLMEDLEQRSRKLAAANLDLEAFSYTIAHDLRAPLRSISGFVSILIDEQNSTLNDESLVLLKRVVASCESMDRLIEGLLELYQLDRANPVFAEVDLSALAQAIAAELSAPATRRVLVEFVIAPGLTRLRRRTPGARNALVNLLGNAWKFTAQATRARGSNSGSMTRTGARGHRLLHPRRRRRLRRRLQVQAVPDLPAPAHYLAVSRHRHRPGLGGAHHPPPRRRAVGRGRGRAGRDLLLHLAAAAQPRGRRHSGVGQRAARRRHLKESSPSAPGRFPPPCSTAARRSWRAGRGGRWCARAPARCPFAAATERWRRIPAASRSSG